MHNVHTDGSGFRRKGHVAHEQGDEKAMQREIDDLKKQPRQAKQKQNPFNSDASSNDEEDTIYSNVLELHQANLSPVRINISPKETYEPLSQRSRERCYEKGIEPNLEITLYTGNRKGETSQKFPPTNVRHV